MVGVLEIAMNFSVDWGGVEDDADLLKYLMCYSLILGGVIRGVGVVKQKRAFVRKPALLLSDSRELFGVFFHNNCGVVTTETK